MKIVTPCCALIRRWSAVFALAAFSFSAVAGTRLDFGVDPTQLGTGEWVYVMKDCVNHLGGPAENVTNAVTMFQFFKQHGVDYVVVKAGTGAKDFPSTDAPQFTPQLVQQAHAAGLKIFGYNRSNGKDVPGEIALACKVNAMGADGFVIDAEAEWESTHLGTQGPALAVQLCQGIRKAYPTRFLGHAPMPIISKHTSFPYKEFGRYCDVVMPQAYWKSIGVSPKRMVDWMEAEWHSWYQTLGGDWQNAIKPLAPIAQAWSPTQDRVLYGAEIVQFANELKALKSPASPGGYKSISYWRCDLHTAGMWKAIERVDMRQTSPTDLNDDEKQQLVELAKVNPAASQNPSDLILDNNGPDVTFEGKWNPGRMKTNHFGSNYECVATVAGLPTAKAIYRPNISKAGKYDIYVWYPVGLEKSGNVPYTIVHSGQTERVLVNQTTNGGQWLLIGHEKYFDAGKDSYVMISNDLGTKDSIIVADAVRFRASATIDDANDELDLTVISPDAPAPAPATNTAVATAAPKLEVPPPTKEEKVERAEAPVKNVEPQKEQSGMVVAKAMVILKADDPGVTFEGGWHEGKLGGGYYTENYQWTSTSESNATASVVFRPDIRVEGAYDVYVWHTVSTNRSRNAHWEIGSEDGVETVRVNQRKNGGHWHLIAQQKHFAVGKSGYLKLSNDTGERGGGHNIIIADAVRLILKGQAKVATESKPQGQEAAHVQTPAEETASKFAASDRDIVLDNGGSEVVSQGKWGAQSATGCFGANCLVSPTTAGTSDASVVYKPKITVAGEYDIYIWYPQTSKNSIDAQWLVSWNGGNAMISVDQTKNGGQWVQIARGKPFSAGTSGSVTLFNDTDDTAHDRVVVADAVRFRLVSEKRVVSTSR